MSPAATVDSRYSSNPSSGTMNSSFPNFNLEGTNASSYINGSECGFNSGSSIPLMVRNGSMSAARPKVRLHKKRANSRPSRSSVSTADSDFNPFRLVADQLKNSDGENVKLGESHNSGFVFSANRSNSSVVLNSENGNDVGSICREKTERGEGCSNSHNAGFVSDYSRAPLSSKSVEQSEAVEKLVSDDKLSCSDRGSVPGSNDSKSVSSLSSEDGGLGGNAENFVNGEGEREKFRTSMEKEKIENVQFVFGSSCFVRECNHGVDKGEDGLKTRATSSECERNANFGVEFRNVDDLSFVFSAGSTNLPPNSVKENDFLENSIDKPPPKDENCGSISSRSWIEENINTGVDSEDCGKKGVVFGDNGVQSAENITSEREEFIDNLGRSVLDDMQKTNLDVGAQYARKPAHCVSFDVDNVWTFDSNKGWEQGVFVFGSSTEASSSCQKRTAAKESDEVKVENIVDDGGVFKNQRANMCPAEFYSEAKLSNELKKLYINTIEKIDHASITHPSTMRTCTDVNDIFIFKGNKVDSGSSTERPEVSPDNPSTSYSEENRDNGVGNISGKSNHSSEEVQNFDPLDNDGIKLNGDAGPSSVPPGHGTQPNYKMYSTCVDERNFEFSIASSSNGSGASSMDLENPLQNALFSFSVNLSQGLNRKLDLGAKTRVATGQKMKRTKGKARQPNPAKQHPLRESLSSRSTPQVNVDSSECYSPMDFSPYEESVAADERAVETSETPEGPPFNEKSHAPFDANYTTVSLDVKGEKLTAGYSGINNGVNITSDNAGAGLASNMGAQGNGRANSFAASSLLDGREKFAFTAAASGPSHVSSRRQGKKKYRMKTGLGSSASSFIQGAPINHTANKFQGENEIWSTAEHKEKHKFIAGEEQEPLSALTVAEKACDKWRLRGNQAYKDGELSKAEDFYTWGINCLPSGEMSGSSVKPLVLCYSNRAATRMAVGKVRQALQDCLSAARLDPDFLKAQLRAANCHLLLGELEDALQNYYKCLESEHDVCLDRQVVIAASDGLQKAQRVMEFTNRSTELLKLGTTEHAARALELIAEAMSISSYSEKLLKMKAEALCMLQKYEEVIQLCQKTFDFAEKNFTLTVAENLVVDHSSWKNEMNVRLWRLYILSKCCFCLGRLESALDVLEKRDCGDKTGESSHPLAVTIRELLKHKNAGNEAFQSGKHAEAIEHYTSAISSSVESRPFAAICFCNRAAAHQALGQIADAISDCSLAIALDENYAKAVSRRATLHEVIRDYKQASADLQRLVSLLEKQSHGKGKQSGSKSEKELRQAYKRLSLMESEAKKGIPLDLYLILGVKRSDSASEIKKAYRKAALRHHPDKAAQAVVKSENGDDGKLWKDIANLVHKDSDRLFKMIGEAYAVLSDTEKRSEYDLKEDMRNATKDSSNVRSTSRRQTDAHNYSYHPSERSSTRQYWNESYYRTYRDDSDPFSKW